MGGEHLVLTREQNRWFKTAVGKAMNPDGAYNLQCKDVIDDYATAIFPGHSWMETVRAENARYVFRRASPKYWTKIRNNPNDLNQLPKRGDVVVWDSWGANPNGHTAVVTEAGQRNMKVIQQDGFRPRLPAQRATYSYQPLAGDGGELIGWLRPKTFTARKRGKLTFGGLLARIRVLVRGLREARSKK